MSLLVRTDCIYTLHDEDAHVALSIQVDFTYSVNWLRNLENSKWLSHTILSLTLKIFRALIIRRAKLLKYDWLISSRKSIVANFYVKINLFSLFPRKLIALLYQTCVQYYYDSRSIDIVDFYIWIILSNHVLMLPSIYFVCFEVSRQLGQTTCSHNRIN